MCGLLSRIPLWGVCQTDTDSNIGRPPSAGSLGSPHCWDVRTSKRNAALPIGRTARIAYELDAMRAACSQAAQDLVRQNPMDEIELDECARLDEALAQAHRILKGAVRNVMLSRLNRKTRTRL